MDSDARPVVNLEISVPILPDGSHRHEPMQAPPTGQYTESNKNEEVPQVRLVPFGPQRDPSLHQPREQRNAIGDVPTRMIHSIRFHMFDLTVPAHDRPFLLQVLHRY